jgi:hypothetical protein
VPRLPRFRFERISPPSDLRTGLSERFRATIRDGFNVINLHRIEREKPPPKAIRHVMRECPCAGFAPWIRFREFDAGTVTVEEWDSDIPF